MLVLRGKYWHVAMWLNGKMRWTSTRCEKEEDALAVHVEIKKRYQETRRRQRIAQLLGEKVEDSKPLPIRNAAAKFAKIYPQYSPSGLKIFRNFQAWLKRDTTDISDINIDTAMKYLSRCTGAKRFNNAKSALSKIWTILSPYTDIRNNIWKDIPYRPIDSECYRPLTPTEYKALINSCDDYLKQALVIGYHTGLRKGDVFGLKWAYIKDGSIETFPGKTRRFGRAVWIPMRPAVIDALKALQNDSDWVFGKHHAVHNSGAFQERLRTLFESCGIKANKEGLVGFRSLRASFITRAEEQGVSRQVLQGIVGHRSPQMTQHYSHDKESAKAILEVRDS